MKALSNGLLTVLSVVGLGILAMVGHTGATPPPPATPACLDIGYVESNQAEYCFRELYERFLAASPNACPKFRITNGSIVKCLSGASEGPLSPAAAATTPCDRVVEIVIDGSEYCTADIWAAIKSGTCVKLVLQRGAYQNCTGVPQGRGASVAAFGDTFALIQDALPAAGFTLSANTPLSITPPNVGETIVYGFVDDKNVQNKFIITTFDASNPAALTKPVWMEEGAWNRLLVSELQSFAQAQTPFVTKVYYYNPEFDSREFREIGGTAAPTLDVLKAMVMQGMVTPDRMITLTIAGTAPVTINLNQIDLEKERLQVIQMPTKA